jgi:hypothetical protein
MGTATDEPLIEPSDGIDSCVEPLSRMRARWRAPR